MFSSIQRRIKNDLQSNNKQVGVTLLEMLTTLTVSGLLASIAIPAYQAMIEQNRITALTNELAISFYLARSEAAKRGTNVTLCASNSSKTACDPNAKDYSNGWIIYTDDSTASNVLLSPPPLKQTISSVADTHPTEILYVSQMNPSGLRIKSNRKATKQQITYRPDGRLSKRQFFSLKVTDAQTGKLHSKVMFNIAGRARACIVRKPGDCGT